MRVAIVGGGVVGLAVARKLVERYDMGVSVDVFRRETTAQFSSSLRNSGVLHAGLYYTPGSLKSRLCQEGRQELEAYIVQNSLPLLECGKILVPMNREEEVRLEGIYETAIRNNAEVSLLSYEEAKRDQQGISRRDMYLWSPRTKVFSSASVMNRLRDELAECKVKFIDGDVVRICKDTTSVIEDSMGQVGYDYIFNTAGPEALRIYQQCSDDLDHLRLVPFLGEYATMVSGPDINTNIYPVPEPEKPFLGIHVTPRPGALSTILGPNAVPSLRSYANGMIKDDVRELLSRIGINMAMMTTDANRYRGLAKQEFTLDVRKKFKDATQRFFDDSVSKDIDVEMCKSVYGVRPQLVDQRSLAFVDDFIVRGTANVLHVVNAISPAFTSSFAIAEYLISMVLGEE